MHSANGHNSDRVALYLRVSSEEQRDAGTIETQREHLEHYCKAHGLEVVATYADDGVSGTIPLRERQAGARLLHDAREGRFRTVIVYKLDRLARTQFGILDAADRLERMGVALRSATEQYETATPQGRLMFQMLGSFAEFEKSNINERTRDGLHRAIRNGKQPGLLPYGYSVGEDGRLVVAEDQARIIRRIFREVAAGATLHSVAKRLTDEGIPSPGWRYKNGGARRAGRWGAPTLKNIIHRSAYIGRHEARITLEDGTKTTVARDVPPIVTQDLRERAIRQLTENKRTGGWHPHRSYLLSGLVRCAVCGCSCSGETHKRGKKSYSYYLCSDDRASRQHRAPRHNAPRAPREWLERLVWANVRKLISDPGAFIQELSDSRERSENDMAELEARHDDLTKRLESLNRQRERSLWQHRECHISDTELEAILADLRTQADNLGILLEAVDADLSEKRGWLDLSERAEAWMPKLFLEAAEADEDGPDAFAKRRELITLLVERVIVGRNEAGEVKADITLRFDPNVPAEAREPDPDWFYSAGEWSDAISRANGGSVVPSVQNTSRSSAQKG